MTNTRQSNQTELPNADAHARAMARATGSTSATVRYEHRDPATGELVTDAEATWTRPTTLQVACHECGALHIAEPSHMGRFGEGQIYAVVCTVDSLTSYYTAEALA